MSVATRDAIVEESCPIHQCQESAIGPVRWIRSCPCVRYPRGRDVWLTLALTIEIDRQHQLPLYLQICERFRAAIAAGHLRPGDRAPAARPGDATEHGARHRRTGLHDPGRRGLSADARRGRHVRLAVLADLADPGIAAAHRYPAEPARRTGGPPRASTPAPSTLSAPSTPLAQSAPSIPPADLQPPRRPQPIAVALSGEPARCNPGPALDAFPRKVWHRLVSRARSGERALLGYPNPAGYRRCANTSPPI